MGLMEFLRQWQRGRLVAGVLASIVLHAIVVALVLGLRLPDSRYDAKRGEPLIVELPKGDDSPPPGRGGAPASAPSPPPSAPAPNVAARPAPPAPKVVAPPAAARAPEPAPQAAPRPEPEPPRQVASAPAAPAPEAAPAPAPPPPPAKPEPAPEPAETPAAETPAQSAAQRQVAALPPQPAARPAPDALSALRRGSGGAGGRGEGRTGIEGEPIPLDSKDPRYSDYLDRVRRAIKEKWGFPCVKNAATHECEYKTTHLIIEFGIAKDGKVPFVTVVRSSGYPIYDDYAVNAVKLAAPFPPIPDSFSKSGVPIHATFSYVVDSSLANILR
jgi:TonB family protein